MSYTICYDIGTSGIKCGLFDGELNCRIITRGDYTVLFADNTAEAEPSAYIDGVVQCTREAMQKSGVDPAEVRALCITTQGETLIPVDKNGHPLYRAIVWLDGRAEAEADELRQKLPDAAYKKKTGLPSVDGFTPLAKLLHIRRQMPEIYEKTEKFMLLEDYVTYCLTGKTVSEKSLLSSTGYFDLTTDSLWQEALDAAGIPADRIPTPVDPGAAVGCLTEEMAQRMGLTAETVLYAGAMDQIAGAVGCGNCEVGSLHETTGTAMIVASTMSLSDAMARNDRLTVYRHAEKDKYLLLSIGRTATSILKWFAEQFFAAEHHEDIYAHLSEVTEQGVPGANGIILLPYFEGTIGSEGAEQLKGTFWNVGLHNTRGDFVRAIFEGVSYMLRDNLSLLGEASGGRQLISIGGASKSDIWCRIKADVTGCEIVTVTQSEAALFGAACIAAVGSGQMPSLQAALAQLKPAKIYRPNPEGRTFYETQYSTYKKMQSSLEKLAAEV